MKKFIINFISYSILIVIILLMCNKINILHKQLDNSINNEKAYAIENSKLIERNRVFKLSIDQLEYYNDSLLVEMKKIANENNIKDKKIKMLQYQLEHFIKRDTILVRDTIFRESDFILDTCITDEWNKSCIHLAYPNIIALSNEYKNDKYVILNSHKELIKPRKWFLPKLFTRKHIIVEILVVDKNPYVTTSKQRYVEIIND